MRILAPVFLALSLAACASAPGKFEPVGPDTTKFRLYTAIGMPESEADRIAATNIDKFRAENGYRSYAVIDRQWSSMPTFYEYTIRFAR